MYHYCLHKFNWTPRQWAELSDRERATVTASVLYQQELEEKERQELEREQKRRKK